MIFVVYFSYFLGRLFKGLSLSKVWTQYFRIHFLALPPYSSLLPSLIPSHFSFPPSPFPSFPPPSPPSLPLLPLLSHYLCFPCTTFPFLSLPILFLYPSLSPSLLAPGKWYSLSIPLFSPPPPGTPRREVPPLSIWLPASPYTYLEHLCTGGEEGRKCPELRWNHHVKGSPAVPRVQNTLRPSLHCMLKLRMRATQHG